MIVYIGYVVIDLTLYTSHPYQLMFDRGMCLNHSIGGSHWKALEKAPNGSGHTEYHRLRRGTWLL